MLSIQSSYVNAGFSLTFANGLTISVQFGRGNYCDNQKTYQPNPDECSNAEVAIWNDMDEFYNFPHGKIADGWVSADDVAKWIHAVQSATNLTDIVVPS